MKKKSKMLTLDAKPKKLKLFGVIFCSIFSVFYNLIFFNKYFPLTEGWFSSYAELVNKGQMPYKDFYFFLTPLYPLQIALFQDIFGNSLIALRILGIAVTTLILVILYLILSRKFSPLASVIGATSAYIYYRSGVAFINYDFTQVLTLYGLAATYCILTWCDKLSTRSSMLYLFFAAIFLSFTVLTKQSNGIFIAFFCTISVLWILIRRNNLKQCYTQFGIFILGMGLPVLLMFGWLLYYGAFQDFIGQVLFGAMSSKGGGPKEVIFGWIFRLDPFFLFARLKLIFIAAVILYASNIFFKKIGFKHIQKSSTEILLTALFFSILIILILLLMRYPHQFHFVMKLFWLEQSQLNFDLLIIAVVVSGAYIIRMNLLGKAISEGFIVLSLAVLGFILGNGTSAGISEISLFVILAYSISYIFSLNQFYGAYKLCALALAFVLILGYTQDKLNSPYAWWYVDEPGISQSTEISTIGLLSGFKLSPKTRNNIDGVVNAVTQNSSLGDDVFVFPNISGIYALSNRWPQSKVIVPWFDFLPDVLAKNEAIRLVDKPPAVIVNLKLPEEAWSLHEKYFRSNGRLGQRDIFRAIEELTLKSKQYNLAFRGEVSKGVDIEVWALRRAGE
jgi:hypothetical protein